MKRLLTLATAAVCLVAMAGSAQAAVGWAGNVWPTNGADVVPTGDVSCYVQVYKDGVTPGAGQGAGIEVVYDMENSLGATATYLAAYQGEVGNNDEYVGAIPQSLLVGAAWVQIHFRVHDTTDDTWYEGTNDQAGNPPPQRYDVVNVLPEDVAVTFELCMSGTPTVGDPCVIGGAAPISAWGAGVPMTYVNTELYTVTVVFPAGSNPSFEYKYKKDGCSDWEWVGNRFVTLPTDGTTDVILGRDSWNNQPLGCTGEFLQADKLVCFQVCLAGVENTGGVCAIGNVPQLSSWGAGTAATMIGPDLYQVCAVFPAGTPLPIVVEYKYKKDDCNTWEGVSNRTLVIDNASPPEQTLGHGWDDAPFNCQIVGAESATWGSLKSLYK